MTFPSDPEIGRIHRYITQKKNFKCYMKEIEDRFQDVDNVKSLILSNTDVFWVAQLGHNKYEVKPKVSVKICQTYINKNVCSGDCGNLHICKELLLSQYSCRSPCKHGFSHNLENSHNKSIVKDAFPKGSHQIKMNLLRGSFPRLCKRFIDKGECEKMCCGYFHICPDYLQGKCSKLCCLELRSGVPKEVIHCLSSKHNTRVRKLFFKGFNKSVMITNTLFKRSTAENEQDDNCSEYLANYAQSTVSEDSLLSDDVSEIGPYSGRRYPPSSVSLMNLNFAVKPKFELCNNYLFQQCNDQYCLQLHLCKEFLINGNKCEVHCKYGFSHDPFDMHNKRVMFKANFLNVPPTIVMEDIRKSFPRVCKDYQEKVCLKNTKCNGVHICEKILHQHVCFVFDCDKCHSFTDDHNSRVLKSYNLSYNSQGLPYILTNLLYSKKMIKESGNELSNIPKRILKKSAESGNELSNIPKSILKTSADEKIITTVSRSGEQNKETLDLSKLKRNELLDRQGPTELEVLQFLLNKGGQVLGRNLVYDVFKNIAISHNGMIEANQVLYDWFMEYRSTFRLNIESNDCREAYGDSFYLCVENIAPCFDYWLKSCTNVECDKFHICKKFLYNKSHPEFSCEYSHEFSSTLNLRLISKHKMNTLSIQDLRSIMRYRYPEVCRSYLLHCGCTEDHCDKVHICGDFLEGKCSKPSGLCNHAHDEALSTHHTVRLMKKFHFSDEQEFKKSIIYWPDPDYCKIKNSSVFLKANFNWLIKAGLCHNDLIGSCDTCNLFHSRARLPYEWQYFVSNKWKSFAIALNKKIEECYCDPVNSSYDVKITINSQVRCLTMSNNKWDSGIYNKSVVQIRRLSTKSSVEEMEAKAGLTVWKWYWKNGSKWQEYDKFTTSEDIEKAYLANPKGTFTFKTDELTYNLSFNSMEQQNTDERYKTKREVRRRPVFRDNVSNVTQVITVQNKLPAHWPISVNDFNLRGGRIDVEISTRTAIEKKFQASIGLTVKVIDIKEVCNAEFYAAYKSKKTSMTSKLGSVTSVNEMLLYHGTSSNTVDGICVQNFDWRLCGTNGTAYGQGSYFAKNASYSHNYSSPDVNRLRYMFLSKVLVGRYTKGNNSMKRPPPVDVSVDEHTLYDSCVDDVTRPTIFVVFERDQCYPQYLITYIHDTDYSNYYSSQVIRQRKLTTLTKMFSSSQISASVSSAKAISSTTHQTPSSSNTSQYYSSIS